MDQTISKRRNNNKTMRLLGFVIAGLVPGIVPTLAFQLQSPANVHTVGWNSNKNVRPSSRLFSSPVNTGLVDVSEAASRDIQTMDQWASACGVQRAEGFQLTANEGEGMNNVFAMTTQDLPANSPVLLVPDQVVLSSFRTMQEIGRQEEAEQLLNSLNEADQLLDFYLMVKILLEHERGPDSPWFPWLNSLPRVFSNGASMTPFCFECLPPLVSALAAKERSAFIYLESALKKVPVLSEQTKANKDLSRWAYQIVRTRSFLATDGSGDLRIAPMADMFNHGSDTEILLNYDEQGNCYAQTTRDVPAGSPLRMRYGDPTNPSYLFARYGFLDESSQATFCKIMIPHKNSELEDMGYAHNRMLFYKNTGDASQEVFDVLLYQILSATNVARRREFYQAHMNGDVATKQAFHQQFWPQTSAKLKEHIDSFLDDLDELSAKGVGKDPREHPRLPLILRHNEFVRNTFLAVKARYGLE